VPEKLRSSKNLKGTLKTRKKHWKPRSKDDPSNMVARNKYSNDMYKKNDRINAHRSRHEGLLDIQAKAQNVRKACV